MVTALTAATALGPDGPIHDAVILVEDGKIRAAGGREQVQIPENSQGKDFGANVLSAGYVDIHIHGAAGYDVMQADGTGLAKVQALLAKHGVTSYCPTTVTAPLDPTLRALDRLAMMIESAKPQRGQAQPIGIHIEGPFLSEARRGVHPPADLMEPSISLFERFWQASRGHIRVMTIAAELPGAAELINIAAQRGVVCSLGHSDATTDPTRDAIAAGARHATHTFNAMRPLDHRDPGILGVVLDDDRVTADIIADGVHVDPSVVELFLKAKGRERAVLITDAISATGMPNGTYQLGSFLVEVSGETCSYQGKLAGSVLTMDRAVRNVMAFAGWTLADAVHLATQNPARVIGSSASKGVLSAGADADIVVLSPAGEVLQTICRGAV
jgi:N-acetylglucosamine-6-phosphate deacetylase